MLNRDQYVDRSHSPSLLQTAHYYYDRLTRHYSNGNTFPGEYLRKLGPLGRRLINAD